MATVFKAKVVQKVEEPKFEIKHIGPHQYIIERKWKKQADFVVRDTKTHEISMTGREAEATKFSCCDAKASLQKIENSYLKYL